MLSSEIYVPSQPVPLWSVNQLQTRKTVIPFPEWARITEWKLDISSLSGQFEAYLLLIQFVICVSCAFNAGLHNSTSTHGCALESPWGTRRSEHC